MSLISWKMQMKLLPASVAKPYFRLILKERMTFERSIWFVTFIIINIMESLYNICTFF